VIWLVTGYLFASIIAHMLVWHLGYHMFTYVREKVAFEMRANFFRAWSKARWRTAFRAEPPLLSPIV